MYKNHRGTSALHTLSATLKKLTRELSCCHHMYHSANVGSDQAAWQFVSVHLHSTVTKLGYHWHLALGDTLEPVPCTQNNSFTGNCFTLIRHTQTIVNKLKLSLLLITDFSAMFWWTMKYCALFPGISHILQQKYTVLQKYNTGMKIKWKWHKNDKLTRYYLNSVFVSQYIIWLLNLTQMKKMIPRKGVVEQQGH